MADPFSSVRMTRSDEPESPSGPTSGAGSESSRRDIQERSTEVPTMRVAPTRARAILDRARRAVVRRAFRLSSLADSRDSSTIPERRRLPSRERTLHPRRR